MLSLTFSFSALNDPIEHATGIEKFELMAKKAGNDVRKMLFKIEDLTKDSGTRFGE